MAEKDNLASIDNVDIEPLTDQDLDSVAGGDSASCGCSNCPTYTCPPKVEQPVESIAGNFNS